jgi:AraC-like DNA-binding protein
MAYRIIQPPAVIAHLVKYFWLLEIDAQHAPVAIRTFVDDSSGIIFHYQRDSNSAAKIGEHLPQYMIYGQATNPSLTHVSGTFAAVGVLFHPQAIHSLFGVDASYLSDKIYSMDEFTKENGLQGRISDAVEPMGKIQLLEECLLLRSKSAGSADRIVSYCIDLIKSHKVSQVRHLTSEIKISERQLERRFRESVGVSPSHYLKLTKFKRVVSALKELKEPRVGAIAHDLEFVDEAHFNKVVKRFSGLNPKPLRNCLTDDDLLNLLIC